ncbi:hypothetical protein ACGFJT_17575 [Actinomadura geliboluensis]|uniref:hypothetical protein n=1 Tax=Actinomadura geliboluensis TaxID=882440 RepID=UPI00371E62C3
MPPRTRPADATPARPVTIVAVVDPVAIIASGSLDHNVYLYDTNKSAGSTGFGTERLRTTVRAGDRLIWNVVVLECETYASLDDIVIDAKVCEPERRVFPGTDIVYWTGTVKKAVTEPVAYRLKFRLGTLTEPFALSTPALAGPAPAAGRPGAVKERS